MRKRSEQVYSRESSATLQLTVSLLYQVNNFLFDFIQIWCIILLESYVVPSWSCVGLVILTKVSHLQFSGCDFCIIYIYLQTIPIQKKPLVLSHHKAVL